MRFTGAGALLVFCVLLDVLTDWECVLVEGMSKIIIKLSCQSHDEMLRKLFMASRFTVNRKFKLLFSLWKLKYQWSGPTLQRTPQWHLSTLVLIFTYSMLCVYIHKWVIHKTNAMYQQNVYKPHVPFLLVHHSLNLAVGDGGKRTGGYTQSAIKHVSSILPSLSHGSVLSAKSHRNKCFAIMFTRIH